MAAEHHRPNREHLPVCGILLKRTESLQRLHRHVGECLAPSIKVLRTFQCISLIIEIILFIACVVFAIKPELWNDPAWIHDNFPALTRKPLQHLTTLNELFTAQQFFISLAVGTLISIILTLWFINIAKRAREYVREKYGHCHQ